jgi:hypothetical protein
MRLSKFARPEGDYLFAGCSGSGQVTRLLRAGKSPLKIQASVRGGHAVVSGSSSDMRRIAELMLFVGRSKLPRIIQND